MPSRVERGPLEWALRLTAVALLVASLVLAFRAGDASRRVVAVDVDGALPPRQRDSLAALRRAGRVVEWRGEVTALAAVAEPTHEPRERWRVAAVGSAGLLLRDSLGPIDSLTSTGTLTTEPTRGALVVEQGRTRASTEPRASTRVRRVLVLARAGWESRFVVAALEDAGWDVDARITLGRGRDVEQGNTTLSVARHSVVVALDSLSAAESADALARFVRAGGGLVLGGSATTAASGALGALLPARVTRLEPPETRSFEGHEPTHALPLHVLGARARDAIVLEQREALPAIVARRVAAGRVIQVGYADTWRWRMEGEGRAVEEHREFWSRVTGLAAAASMTPRVASTAVDEVPRAALVHALGDAAEGRPPLPEPKRLPPWLAIAILTLLLAEWLSRRSRGFR